MYTQGFHGWLLPRKGAILQFGITVTRPSRDDVYSLISDVDAAGVLNQTGDSESPAQTRLKLQKEAETFFSSIVTNLPERLIGILALTRPSLSPCPRLPCMGRLGTAGRGSLLNPHRGVSKKLEIL
jgi:hypothetical protein